MHRKTVEAQNVKKNKDNYLIGRDWTTLIRTGTDCGIRFQTPKIGGFFFSEWGQCYESVKNFI